MKKTGKTEKKKKSESGATTHLLSYNIYLQYIKLKIQ